MEGHRSASVSYSKFSRNISVELSLPVKERLVNGTDFLSTQRSELDRLIEQSPNIPSDIVNGFDKVFTKRDSSGNKIDDETTFYKPEILDIRPVAIYEKTKEEREEEDKAKRVEELKWNKQLKDMVIQDDNKRRGEIYNDVVKQLRDAHDIQQNPVMPVKDETEPDSIVLEMSNIMKELNMNELNELNDLGYDIEKDELVDTPFKSTVDITEEVKQDNAATIPEESTPLEKKPDTAIPEEVDDGEEEVVEESPPVVDLSDNDVSGNNVILGKIDIE